METVLCRQGRFPGAILETFLVEWKPRNGVTVKTTETHLETFLVEWKPQKQTKVYIEELTLETFLVEWKLEI